jgi:hypothetical protein
MDYSITWLDHTIAWFATLLALYGTWLNSKQDRRGFYYWIATNTAFCLLNVKSGQMAQAFLFGVYVLLAVKGLEEWHK